MKGSNESIFCQAGLLIFLTADTIFQPTIKGNALLVVV